MTTAVRWTSLFPSRKRRTTSTKRARAQKGDRSVGGNQLPTEDDMAATDLFAGTDRHALYNAGERIFGRGETGSLMYAVLEGAVDIVLKGRHIETVTVGGVFGEMALIDDEPRSAEAVAQVKTRVVEIDRDSFLALVQLSPEFALDVMGDLTRRLRHMDALARTF